VRARHISKRYALLCVLLAASAIGACTGGSRSTGPDVIVLGIDGLDYALTRELIDAGRMPNFKRLEESGSFGPLETSLTPQSPVAWSNFITGLDSGGHGIYDFLHRDLERDPPLPFGWPYQSMTKETPVGRSLTLGDWSFPLSGGDIQLARYGTPFWQLLTDNGIDSTLVRMPANFPPVGVGTRELSGMGTPDLGGTPGEFTFFSTDRRQFMKTDVSGGHIYPADVIDGVFNGTLYALTDNPFTLEEGDAVGADFEVFIDPDNPVVKIVINDQELILQEGEWSPWVSADFELVPYVMSISGAVRFYLKSVREDFGLYITPIQIDPLDPASAISHPTSFATELGNATGRYYTQEMPQDTKAIQWGVFDLDEFLAQVALTRAETTTQYKSLLDNWDGGFLFSYFGSVDQTSHVMWGLTLDPEHPAYVADSHDPYRDVVPALYEEFDALVGYTLDRISDDTLLVVMSDHGFGSWRRTFHLNTWLYENGYMALQDRTRLPVREFFTGVDWDSTQAYSVGISALYLNLRGREPQGFVAPGDRDELLLQIERDLLATLDPATGEPTVTRVFIRDRDFHDRGNLEIGPDIIVGYAQHVRGSGNGALGGLAAEFITDNTDEWSGSHIWDPTSVPGVLLTSRTLTRPASSLQNLAAALLAEYGVDGFPDGSTPVTIETN